MADFMADLGSVLMDASVRNLQDQVASQSTNLKAGKDLDMTDFLTLMVSMFQNQSIDDTASTADMMNQMMQMNVINAVTNMSNLLTQSTNLTYAASLVGKEVTIGQYEGTKLKEVVGTVTGTGTLDGKQVIFVGDESYWLSDVMAVGRLPDAPLKDAEKADEGRAELADDSFSTAQNLLLQNGQRTFMGEPTVEDVYENTNGVASAGDANAYDTLTARAAAAAETESVRQFLSQDGEEENSDSILPAAEEIYESTF